jgi:hypothetical protein
MATSREKCLEVWLPTDSFLCLVEKAASDCHDNTISAETKPVTNLKFTNNCENVQKELEKSYPDMIKRDSSTIEVFDPNKFELNWAPETFVLTGGSFKIPPKTSAVVIPLVKDGNPKIEYHNSHGVTSAIDWNMGSVIYLAGKSSLRSDGHGNASCIFLLFKMKA